jgi:hypothetical protein
MDAAPVPHPSKFFYRKSPTLVVMPNPKLEGGCSESKKTQNIYHIQATEQHICIKTPIPLSACGASKRKPFNWVEMPPVWACFYKPCNMMYLTLNFSNHFA